MSLIFRSAYLYVCEGCGEHGYIAFSNGMATQSFCSKEEARRRLELACQEGVITKEEVVAVKEQISNCSLPSSEEDADVVVRLIEKLRNKVLLDLDDELRSISEAESETVH